MINEQLTQEVLKLAEHQAKCDAERDSILITIEELREDIKSTKTLAEDVHIMAINMKSMEKAQSDTNIKLAETNKKVDEISSQEFLEYKENKKIVKSNVISALSGAIVSGVLAIILWILTQYFGKGGV